MKNSMNQPFPTMRSFLNRWWYAPVAAALLTGCEFSSSFEQIEENRVRTIDFIYRNPADTTICEASPGDSMEITALFAGEKVNDISLSVSFNVQTSVYGEVTASDSMPLDYSVVKSTLRLTGTDADTFTIRFKIPDDMLATSSYLPEKNWAATLPGELAAALPQVLTDMKKSEIVGLLDMLSEMPDPPDSLASFSLAELLPFVETILQIFSAPVELKVTVNERYEIVSYCTVRYHRKLRRLDESILCNRNPIITRMGIYRVYRNNLSVFDPSLHSQRHDTILLFDRENEIDNREYTLHIDTDESYFLFAESDEPQKVRSLSGAQVPETHYFEWFYQQDFTGNDSVPSAERMALLNSADGPIIPLLPASTRQIDHCGIWIQVRDDALGPRMYPTGSSVFGTEIHFAYSDEYIHKQEVLK
ncbi:MAG: hypothetical protein JW863_05355 [Chitinispirillaceae bacterium]|nr:hypothetical protein [Chitinispirillaceae bacterium]